MVSKVENLQDLVPSHLMDKTSTADLKAATVQKMEAAQVQEDPRLKLMEERVYTFSFLYEGKRGTRWEGTFTNTVPGVREKEAIGILRGQLAAGIPFDVLDPQTRDLNLVIAYLTFSLGEARPEWAKDLRKVENFKILFKLYDEVALHEETFLE